MKAKVLILMLMVAVMTLAACNSSKTKEQAVKDKNMTEGVFVDMSNVDGCGWIIKLPDGSKMQPTNLSQFDITPEENMTVLFTYKKSDLAGVCMMGQMIELTSIKEKKTK